MAEKSSETVDPNLIQDEKLISGVASQSGTTSAIGSGAINLEPSIARSEDKKADGNNQFKSGAYLEAYDLYTEAIEACPGISGNEILKMRDEFESKEREKAWSRYNEERKCSSADPQETNSSDSKQNQQSEFIPPKHEHWDKLSVYHCNRAACLLHLGKYDDAIRDCEVALILNPRYSKALIRRMSAYEKSGRTEEALKDAKHALEFEPSSTLVKKSVDRLQKIEDQRMEQLKEETLSKLKDLGNNVLGNFGLSLDNFKANKDPNTGSYSISFEQNP